MENANINPFFIALGFIARCLVPLLIMLGISYLLKRFGLISPPPETPSDKNNGDNNHHEDNGKGGFAHV